MKLYSIRISITASCSLLMLSAFLALGTAGAALAQNEDQSIEQSFKKLSAEEEAKLRAIIAQPLNKDGLKAQLESHINEKLIASVKLGDWPLTLAAHKEAAELLPFPRYRNDLAWRLLQRGDTKEGNYWSQEAIKAATDDFNKAFYHSNAASQLYDQNQNELSRQNIALAEGLLKTPGRQNWQQLIQARTLANINRTKSQLLKREGKFEQALAAALVAETHGRNAAALGKNNASKATELYAYQTFLNSLSTKFYALLDMRRPQEAEKVLLERFRFLNEKHLSAADLVGALRAAAEFRFYQREFASQERLERQALTQSLTLKYDAGDPRMTSHSRQLALALTGQKRFPEALAEFDKLDALAGSNTALQQRVLYRFDRAVVYLLNDKHTQAAQLLAVQADAMTQQYSSTHFFAAQASGLQGAALWRAGTAESKAQAYPLLKAAVFNIMSPANADYLENTGIRKELRELIFETYIEAVAQSNPADAVAALGIADWLRGGLVQEALGDAAVRAAATNDALANLVRQDQDARNEVKGLRSYLSGESGGSTSHLPEVAAKMRERIGVLEKARTEYQTQIKAKFPEYEKLVRPTPPSSADIQSKLGANEALIVLQPTANATYVWVMNREGTGTFYRADVSSSALGRLVRRMRSTLDVAGVEEKQRPVFDSAASQELYQKLLAPLQNSLSGKSSLIVAAGGVLGQIPFAVLQPSSNQWLIQQAAVTHVPSVAAWLSMRAVAHKPAELPMLAWGDPLFNVALASSGSAQGGAVRKVGASTRSAPIELDKAEASNDMKYADIPALPETRDELLAIAKTLGADSSKDLIFGAAATRESVLRENKSGSLYKRRLIAFATHGLMSGELPNLTQPALAMAGTKEDATNILAPLLTLEDVLTLKLNADWVVLSACNTAAADGKAEEALSGLARGFFYAGTRSLLVTHWAVDSDSAVTLTTETFKHNQSNPTAHKAESLRQAMLTVLASPKTAHPTFWAPYALVGDGAR